MPLLILLVNKRRLREGRDFLTGMCSPGSDLPSDPRLPAPTKLFSVFSCAEFPPFLGPAGLVEVGETLSAWPLSADSLPSVREERPNARTHRIGEVSACWSRKEPYTGITELEFLSYSKGV